MSDTNPPPTGAGAGVRIENNPEGTVIEVGASAQADADRQHTERRTKRKLATYTLVNRSRAVFLGQKPELESVSNQIEELSVKLIHLIPMEESLVELTKLREPVRIRAKYTTSKASTSSAGGIEGHTRVLGESYRKSDEVLSELWSIEKKISPQAEANSLAELGHYLSLIADQINLKIVRLNYLFNSAVYPVLSRKDFVQSMVFKIGNRQFRAEAEMHLSAINSLIAKLDDELLIDEKYYILSDEAETAVSIMTAIEKRKILVEELVRLDQTKRNRTVQSILVYIWVALTLAIIVPLLVIVVPIFLPQTHDSLRQLGLQLPVNLGNTSLDQLKTPLLGIPFPVIIWSLIGSFAAVIHRFNRQPIHDFDDAVKWMLTRPVQGVVLGSAFYLVLISGLFLLTSGDPSTQASSPVKDEVILVLSFLIGFSDRFVDSVFNALVDRYSSEKKHTEPKVTDESIEKQSSRSSEPSAKKTI